MGWLPASHPTHSTTTRTVRQLRPKPETEGRQRGVIRLFSVYYPIRTLVLLGGEALLVWTSFLIAAVWQHPEHSYVMLNYEGAYLKVLVATAAVLVFSHLFDLYEPARWNARRQL